MWEKLQRRTSQWLPKPKPGKFTDKAGSGTSTDTASEKFKETAGSGTFTDTASDVPSVSVNYAHRGRPLVELSSLHVNFGEAARNFYGEMTVTDGLSTQRIYDRKKEDCESLKSGDIISLIGPDRSISAYGSSTIDVHLKDKDRSSPDDEVIKGKISWNVYDVTNRYDEPLSEEVKGLDGSVIVNYIVFKYAVQAAVKFMLVNIDGDNPIDVYGKITSHYGKFRDLKNVLFHKAPNKYINVTPGKPIPLLRSIVAVPLNSSLIVSAKLFVRKKTSSDSEFAWKTARFYVGPLDKSEKDISFKHGNVQLTVTWT